MQSKRFRVQRDSLNAINISMALFLKLLTNTCEVVQSTSASSIHSGGRRAANTLDLDHLCKAVKRYDVLAFMADLVEEMNVKDHETKDLELIGSTPRRDSYGVDKRKDRTASEVDHSIQEPGVQLKKHKDSSQVPITSFFKAN